MFNFIDIITKYSQPLIVVNEAEGRYDYNNGGVWVPGGLTEVEFNAAMMQIPRKELKAQYEDGGVYTTEDRKLYTYTKLTIGQKIIDRLSGEDKIYTVDSEMDYSFHADGLRIYYVRRASK